MCSFCEPSTARYTGSKKDREGGREAGSEGTSKGELLLVVMAAGKCTLGSSVSKVKRDARAPLVSLRQTNSSTCS